MTMQLTLAIYKLVKLHKKIQTKNKNVYIFNLNCVWKIQYSYVLIIIGIIFL